MNKYIVRIPVTAVLEVEVEADNEEQAIELSGEINPTIDDIVEWETHENIVMGNVFYGLMNDIEVEQIED